MDEPIIEQPSEELSFWDQHRFLLLVGITIVVAMILVSVSLVIYNLSGAAQLDLSRPDYRSVTSQATNDESSFENYAASGTVNTTTINEFKTLYAKQVNKAKAVDAFSGDPLNSETLEFGTVSSTE
jgi:hypothetical protein